MLRATPPQPSGYIPCGDTSETRLTSTALEDRLVDAGEVDASTCASLDEWLTQHGDCARIVVDMAEVTFIDSSGRRVLVAHNEQAAADGRSLEVTNPSRTVHRLLEITGLADVFNVSSI